MDSDGNLLPLGQNTMRHFVYVRYNADLSEEGLAAMGLGNLDPSQVREMDSVAHIDEMRQVGRAASKQVSLSHFGSFV